MAFNPTPTPKVDAVRKAKNKGAKGAARAQRTSKEGRKNFKGKRPGRAGKTAAMEKSKGVRKSHFPSNRNAQIDFLAERGFNKTAMQRDGSLLNKAKQMYFKHGDSGKAQFNRFQRKTLAKADAARAKAGQATSGAGDTRGNNQGAPATGGGKGRGKGGRGGGRARGGGGHDDHVDTPDLGLPDIDISDINSKKLAALLTRRQFSRQFRELDEQIGDVEAQGESNIGQISDFFDEAQVIRKRAAQRAGTSGQQAQANLAQSAEAQVAGAQEGQEAAIQRQVSAIQSQFSGEAALASQANENFFNRLQGDLAEGESKAKLTEQRITGAQLRDLRRERRGLEADRGDAALANFQQAEQLKLGRAAAVQNMRIGAALAPGQVALQDEQLKTSRSNRQLREQEVRQQRRQNKQNQKLIAQQIRSATLANDVTELQISDHIEAKQNAGKPVTIDGLDFAARDQIKASITANLLDAEGNPKFNPKQTGAALASALQSLGFVGGDRATKTFVDNVLTEMFPDVASAKAAVSALLNSGFWGSRR